MNSLSNSCTGLNWLTSQSDRPVFSDTSQSQGWVAFVGAGPGDPELLTLKAYRLLQQADIVLYDALVSADILALIPEDCEIQSVGKRCGKHSVAQSDISKMIVQYANAGRRLVRLKGGDPSMFGRTPEEAEALMQSQIPFTIIPGITAASGCSASTGIPLTYRGCANSVRFITAHQQDAAHEPDWAQLVKDDETLVFYMGLKRVKQIAEQLIRYGMNPEMPFAIVDKATTTQQTVLVHTLQSVLQAEQLPPLTGPALLIIGEVVDKRYTMTYQVADSAKVC